ncbi:MAG: permease, partial [Sedimentisphaerales bacterium]|nr:permease [Sedimentisphaerales bacterium]
MDFKKEWKKLLLVIGGFLLCFYLPVGRPRFDSAVSEALHLVRWYAREHVLLCLIPAFFIAGGIAVFVSQASVMKYLGARANKVLAYGVASVSGTILAVCSCTVLPLFAGIHRMGAGLGPATAFLYSGPAINVLAIILTARVLGLEIGIARAVGAIIFSVVIGLLMHLIFRKEELQKAQDARVMPEEEPARPLWKNALFFASMVGILVFANWARSGDVRAVFLCCPNGLSTYQVEGTVLNRGDGSVAIRDTSGQTHQIPADQLQTIEEIQTSNLYQWIYNYRWWLVAGFLIAFALMVSSWFSRPEVVQWVDASWGFAVQILPLLLLGVVISGLLLGRPGSGQQGLIPNEWVNAAVGGNSLWANLFASVAGAFMYFATLT